MQRLQSLTIAFAITAAVTLLLLVALAYASDCRNTDAAGCGMQQGFMALIVGAGVVYVALLSALFLIRRRGLRIALFVLLLPATVASLLALIWA